MEQQKMVRISVEVRSGTARFRVGVQAPSIREALGVVAGRYPRGVVGVAFPIEPEASSSTGHRPRQGCRPRADPEGGRMRVSRKEARR